MTVDGGEESGEENWTWKRQQPADSWMICACCLSCFGGIFTRGHMRERWNGEPIRDFFISMDVNLNLSRWISSWMSWSLTLYKKKRQSNGRADWQVAIKCAIQRWYEGAHTEQRETWRESSNAAHPEGHHGLDWLTRADTFLSLARFDTFFSFFLSWPFHVVAFFGARSRRHVRIGEWDSMHEATKNGLLLLCEISGIKNLLPQTDFLFSLGLNSFSFFPPIIQTAHTTNSDWYVKARRATTSVWAVQNDTFQPGILIEAAAESGRQPMIRKLLLLQGERKIGPKSSQKCSKIKIERYFSHFHFLSFDWLTSRLYVKHRAAALLLSRLIRIKFVSATT